MPKRQHLGLWWIVCLAFLLGGTRAYYAASAASHDCVPTAPDSLGPFYQPHAPVRDTTGTGLHITGSVRAATGCRPLVAARLEWWSANSHGDYDMAHRATQQAGSAGQYQYTTDFPGSYPGRPPHLHVRITAPRHRTLVTQVYPQPHQTALSLDFVLLAP